MVSAGTSVLRALVPQDVPPRLVPAFAVEFWVLKPVPFWGQFGATDAAHLRFVRVTLAGSGHAGTTTSSPHDLTDATHSNSVQWSHRSFRLFCLILRWSLGAPWPGHQVRLDVDYLTILASTTRC